MGSSGRTMRQLIGPSPEPRQQHEDRYNVSVDASAVGGGCRPVRRCSRRLGGRVRRSAWSPRSTARPSPMRDMKLAEAEIGSDLGSLPEATKRRVLVEFLIENQLFADAAEGQKLASGARLQRAHAVLAAARAARRLFRHERQERHQRRRCQEVLRRPGGRGEARGGGARPPHPGREQGQRPASCSRSSRTGQRFRAAGQASIPRTRARRTRAASSASSRAGRWCRSSRRPAFKLKKGEVGEPFQSQFGWHIVRVDDRRQRCAPSLRGGQGPGGGGHDPPRRRSRSRRT